MRRVFDQFLQPEDILSYFDPDITIKCRWSFFEEWVQNGLALVEDSTFGKQRTPDTTFSRSRRAETEPCAEGGYRHWLSMAPPLNPRPIDPRVEFPEEIRDRVLEAGRYIQ
jgi:hypothetical protein